MAKVQRQFVSPHDWKAMEKELETCLLTLPKRKEIIGLLLDLLSESERIMIVRRLRIARRLLLGHSYLVIRRSLGVGLHTIQDVHRWLNRRFRDYRKILRPVLERAAERGAKERRIGTIPLDPLSFRAIRKKYPTQSLLFTMLLGDPDIYEEEPESTGRPG